MPCRRDQAVRPSEQASPKRCSSRKLASDRPAAPLVRMSSVTAGRSAAQMKASSKSSSSTQANGRSSTNRATAGTSACLAWLDGRSRRPASLADQAGRRRWDPLTLPRSSPRPTRTWMRDLAARHRDVERSLRRTRRMRGARNQAAPSAGRHEDTVHVEQEERTHPWHHARCAVPIRLRAVHSSGPAGPHQAARLTARREREVTTDPLRLPCR